MTRESTNPLIQPAQPRCDADLGRHRWARTMSNRRQLVRTHRVHRSLRCPARPGHRRFPRGGISRPAARRLLLTLEALKYLPSGGSSYQLTTQVLAFADGYLGSRAIHEIAHPGAMLGAHIASLLKPGPVFPAARAETLGARARVHSPAKRPCASTSAHRSRQS
jgi:hypothetical protein